MDSEDAGPSKAVFRSRSHYYSSDHNESSNSSVNHTRSTTLNHHNYDIIQVQQKPDEDKDKPLPLKPEVLEAQKKARLQEIEGLKKDLDTKAKYVKLLEALQKVCEGESGKDHQLEKKVESCNERNKLEAILNQHVTELQTISSKQYRVLEGIRGICGIGQLPKIEYTCEPVELPLLEPPTLANLDSLPKKLPPQAVPPIIWHHDNICLDSIKLPKKGQTLTDAEKEDIEKLRRACTLFKSAYAARIGYTLNKNNADEEKNQTDDLSKDDGEHSPEKETKQLISLLGHLEVEIEAAKASTQKGRRRIIELCIELKQREAAIIECSEMLCHIMEEQNGAGNLLIEWQNSKLARYIEYLRWYLIRLTYEKQAQATEIGKLEKSLNQQQNLLLECLETKRRICDAKKEKQMTAVGGYDPCSISFKF